MPVTMPVAMTINLQIMCDEDVELPNCCEMSLVGVGVL